MKLYILKNVSHPKPAHKQLEKKSIQEPAQMDNLFLKTIVIALLHRLWLSNEKKWIVNGDRNNEWTPGSYSNWKSQFLAI